MKGYSWTREELDILKESYAHASKDQIISMLPHRTWMAITLKAERLGLKSAHLWRKAEDALLLKHPHLQSSRLQKILPDRSIFAIQLRRKHLGIKFFKRKTNVDLSRPQCVWLAILIDSEGTLGIYRAGRYFQPTIAISNTYKELLEHAMRLLKLLRSDLNSRPADPARNRKALHVIQFSNLLGVMHVLEQIEPYLIVKKRNATLIIEFCKSRLANRGKPYTERERQIINEVRVLNKRGPE